MAPHNAQPHARARSRAHIQQRAFLQWSSDMALEVPLGSPVSGSATALIRAQRRDGPFSASKGSFFGSPSSSGLSPCSSSSSLSPHWTPSGGAGAGDMIDLSDSYSTADVATSLAPQNTSPFREGPRRSSLGATDQGTGGDNARGCPPSNSEKGMSASFRASPVRCAGADEGESCHVDRVQTVLAGLAGVPGIAAQPPTSRGNSDGSQQDPIICGGSRLPSDNTSTGTQRSGSAADWSRRCGLGESAVGAAGYRRPVNSPIQVGTTAAWHSGFEGSFRVPRHKQRAAPDHIRPQISVAGIIRNGALHSWLGSGMGL